MVVNDKILPNLPYKNATGAIVQTWRPGHWSSWMFEVENFDVSKIQFIFSKGGFQGARGNDRGDEFYIENVLEELDNPNEWYYDSEMTKLYFYYNASSGTPPPAQTIFEAVQLKTFFNITAVVRIRQLKDYLLWGSISKTRLTLTWTHMVCLPEVIGH